MSRTREKTKSPRVLLAPDSSERPGHGHSADDWQRLLAPVVARYRDSGLRKYLRADAAFAKPEVYQYLEEEG